MEKTENYSGNDDSKLSQRDLSLIKFLIDSDEYKWINLSTELITNIYFYNKRKSKYVLLTFDSFSELMINHNFKINYLKNIYYNLLPRLKNNYKMEDSTSFMNNLIFKNGTLIINKNKLSWSKNKELGFTTINHNIYIDENTDEYIKKHKYLQKMINLFKAINDEHFKYFSNLISSIFLSNELVSSIFWIKGNTGLGKSSFFQWIVNDVLGTENTSAVLVNDFLFNGGNQSYQLPLLKDKILNVDDEYNECPIKDTGFLKQFATGKSKIQVNPKKINPFIIYPRAKLFFLTNHYPNFKKFDVGDIRRNILFEWKGEWKKYGITDFDFLQDKEFIELFLTYHVYKAIKIAKKINNNPMEYSETTYFKKSLPEKLKLLSKFENSVKDSSIKEIKNFLLEFELTENEHGVDAKSTFNTFKEFNSDFKINYKDFLSTLKHLNLISQSPLRKEGITYYEKIPK